VLHAKTEPTSTLQNLRAAYTHEASGVIRCQRHGSLEAIGEFRHRTDVADRAADDTTLVLHVFARSVAGPEEHVLVLWPATGG
jgi:hypothetical protein